MSMRREQWLLLVVIAIGVWYFTSFSPPMKNQAVSPKRQKLEQAADLMVVLAPSLQEVGPIRDVTLEPSESVPLPPRVLPFPDLERIPIVLPPLDPGQSTGQYYQLRHVAMPTPHTEFKRDDPGQAGIANANGGGVAVEAPRLYDELVLKAHGAMPVEILNENRFELEAARTIIEPIRYHWLKKSDLTVIKRDQVAEPDQVVEIRLAETLENEMGRTAFHLRGAGPAMAPDRKKFITRLLIHGPEHPQFYIEAERQAQKLIEQANRLEGYRWMKRVLRAQGAIGREWQLYVGEAVPEDLRGTEFQARGRGELEAALSLWSDAEEHLRRAAATDANGRSNASLAELLLQRGRVAEALEASTAAFSKRGRIQDAHDKHRVASIHVRALLANGQTDVARNVANRLGLQNGLSSDSAYLKGAAAYAAGEYDAANGHFTDAATDATVPNARLGIGLCALAQSRWDDAYSNLMWVVDNGPMLRHRAYAALAVLYELTDNLDTASDAIDKALLAAPSDPYNLYLEGRLHRLAGNFDAAVESNREALAQRDDLVESLAEIAAALFEQSQLGDADDPEDLLASASRYADRLVRLDASRGNSRLFLELQGLIKFRLGEMAGAREAFDAASARGSDFGLIGLGAIAYKQLRTAEARDGFVDLANDPARPETVKEFARTLVDLIDDHANKEQVRDTFDREELGELWAKNPSGRVGPKLDGDVVRFKGVPKATPAYIRRDVTKAGNFLRTDVSMTIDAGSDLRFAGIELSLVARNRAKQNFRLRFGVHLGTDQTLAPYVFMKDGTRDDSETSLVIDVPDFAPSGERTIAVATRPGEKPSTFALDLLWNGEVVHSFEEVRTFRPTTGTPLAVDLVVEGRSGGSVNVTFDDFRMNRRRER